MISVANAITTVDHCCFKCRSTAAGRRIVSYLGHQWCLECAQAEARIRYERSRLTQAGTTTPTDVRKAATTNGTSSGVDATRLSESRGWHVDTSWTSVGAALLGVGVCLVLWTLAGGARDAQLAGPTLTLAGAILVAARTRRP